MWHTHPQKYICKYKKLAEFFFKSAKGLNKDPTVWLDGAGHTNTSKPPSFLRNEPTQQCGIPIPKNTFANIKFGRILFKNQPRAFNKDPTV
jgi:hypothetical protein